MPAPTPSDLRAAALSDAKNPLRTPGTGLLNILLPDIPSEPYGGTATPEQTRAVAEATGETRRLPVLRDALRHWAAQQADSDNAAGLRGALHKLPQLDANGHSL